MSATTRTTCRVCGEGLGLVFLDLGVQPPANNLPSVGEKDPPGYPLELVRCGGCGHVQLTVTVDPEVLFGHYLYTPSQSASFRKHFSDLAAAVDGNTSGRVLDIGSNDGLFLGHMRVRGWKVVGVDPAKNLAAEATAKGIPTVALPWGAAAAHSACEQAGGTFDLVVATNVFAHVEDPVGFVKWVRSVLTPSGRFVIETPSLVTMLTDGTWDLVYHEHQSYWSTLSLSTVLARGGLRLVAVEDVPIHGGSLRAVAVRDDSTIGCDEALIDRLRSERAFGFEDACWALARQAGETRHALTSVIRRERGRGRRVIGYGAPAKATVVMNFCGLRGEDVEYVVDDSPLKVGRVIPGTEVPVVGAERLAMDLPDVVVIWPWNVAEDIAARLPDGVRALVPMPEVRWLAPAVAG